MLKDFALGMLPAQSRAGISALKVSITGFGRRAVLLDETLRSAKGRGTLVPWLAGT